MNAIEKICKGVYLFLRKPSHLTTIFNKVKPVTNVEKKMITEIVNNLIFLNYLSEKYIKKFKKFSKSLKSLIYTGIYEILFSHHLKPSEVISAILSIMDKYNIKPHLKPVVCATLNRVKSEKSKILSQDLPVEVRYSIPQNVATVIFDYCQNLKNDFKYIHSPTYKLGINIKNSILMKNLIMFFKKNSIAFKKGLLCPDYIYTKYPIDKFLSISFLSNGDFYFQDEAMSFICYKISKYIEENSVILDYCSAPGGKTITVNNYLSFQNTFFICYDKNFKRLLKLKENLSFRPHINALIITDLKEKASEEISRKIFDKIIAEKIIPAKLRNKILYIENWEEVIKNKIDYVILDVPCSGLGTLYKNPEIKYLFSNDGEITYTQSNLLEKAKDFVKMEGKIFYITCTLNYRENEERIKEFLHKNRSFSELEKLKICPGKSSPSGGFLSILKKEK